MNRGDWGQDFVKLAVRRRAPLWAYLVGIVWVNVIMWALLHSVPEVTP